MNHCPRARYVWSKKLELEETQLLVLLKKFVGFATKKHQFHFLLTPYTTNTTTIQLSRFLNSTLHPKPDFSYLNALWLWITWYFWVSNIIYNLFFIYMSGSCPLYHHFLPVMLHEMRQSKPPLRERLIINTPPIRLTPELFAFFFLSLFSLKRKKPLLLPLNSVFTIEQKSTLLAKTINRNQLLSKTSPILHPTKPWTKYY